jgi:membrane-associated protease RseP (regulator of RpoE activity)
MSRRYVLVPAFAALLIALASQAFADGEAYLGVEVSKLTGAWRSKLSCKGDGVVVLGVAEGSPAEACGIEEGDIIRKIDGEAVVSPGSLARVVGMKKPKDVVKVELFRNGKEISVSATLEAKQGIFNELPGRVKRFFYVPQGEDEGDISLRLLGEQPEKWIGVRIEELSEQLAGHFGVKKGLLVAEVVQGSPADKAGLRAGDVIQKADGSAIESVAALKESVAEKKVDEVLKLGIVGNGKEIEVDVPVEKNPFYVAEPRRGIRSWFRDLQDRLGSPRSGGKCEVNEDGEPVCSDGPSAHEPHEHKHPGEEPGGVWDAQEELHTQIGELREKVQKMEKELKELKEKAAKK